MASPGTAASTPLGVVLAGGAGRRLGQGKPAAPLAGRPLAAWACDALRSVLGEVAILAKPDTALPELPGIAVWREPAEPRHPLFGLIRALEQAAGRPILVCAVDLPLVGADLLAPLAAPLTGAAARVAAADGRLQPLLGRYEPAALGPLRAALAGDGAISLRRAVSALGPEVLDAPPAALVNVNTPADLVRAARVLTPG
jgi:molybdopterin-guanine dinucleotide biosynthesis protein A